MKIRTTLNLDPVLYRLAKIEAATEGTTVTNVIEEAIKVRLRKAEKEHAK